MDTVYEEMPALRKIHQLIGYAFMQNRGLEVLQALGLVRKDFLREHKKTSISPENYAAARRIYMVEHTVTYYEGIGNREADWLGLNFNFPSVSGKGGVYELAKSRLEMHGTVIPDPRNQGYTRIRVQGEKPKTFEEYLLDEETGHLIFIKVFDRKKGVPIKGPIRISTSKS